MAASARKPEERALGEGRIETLMGALRPVLQMRAFPRALQCLGLPLAAFFIAGCVRPAPQPAFRPGGPDTALVRSNVERADYAGSQSCAPCHRELYDRFMASPMHNMTRLPGGAPRGAMPPAQSGSDDPRALFDGRTFRFKHDQVILEDRGGKPFMRIESPEFGNRLFRVTKFIGGHHRRDFAGVEAGSKDTLSERILPVSYMVKTGAFRYKGYSVMDPERPGLKPGAVWNKTCLFCHNTVPYLSTLLRELAGPEAPPYQGSDVDRLLPADKRQALVVTDPAGLRKALLAEIDFLRRASGSRAGSVPAAARKALNVTWDKFNETHLLEIGIGCESCHGGSREHVLNPRIWPSLQPQSPYFHVAGPPGREDAMGREDAVTRACARCHQVLFTGYPWTWEGKARDDSLPGGAHINSGEARDLLLSNCRVTCTACHDPHAADNGERMQKLEGPAGNLVCLACHGKYADPQALAAHAHHDPQGPGGLCLNCHMPKKNMSLDTRLGRYHRIGSPTEAVKVEGDRPLECALCHGEKTVGQLVDTMESWWGHRYDRGKLAALYGELNQGSLLATLRMGKPHEKAVALGLAGSTGNTASGEALEASTIAARKEWVALAAREMADPYPLVRYYADDALTRMLGTRSPLDLHADADSLMRAASLWLQSAGYPALEPWEKHIR